LDIYVLRIGHRMNRDKRVTTHAALVSRAFGAKGIYISPPDKGIEKTIKGVNERFGGSFQVESIDKWHTLLNSWKGVIVHLTMYGIPLWEVKGQIKKEKEDLLVVIGATKVPIEVYLKANYNVAIYNQPHSEISALAIFLHDVFPEKAIKENYNGKLKIIPKEKGKMVVENQYL